MDAKNKNIIILVTRSSEETLALGQAIGEVLKPGAVIALIGELGAGKTVFSKGLALGLGFKQIEKVTSPTYKLLNQYAGPVTINHFDAYRLSGSGDFIDIGGEEMLNNNSVTLIEWADIVQDILPEHTIVVTLSLLSETERDFQFNIPYNNKNMSDLLDGLNSKFRPQKQIK